MLNIKRIDHVLNTTVYSMTNTVRHRQLKFLGHILRMSKEEPTRRYALYIPTIGKKRPGRPRTSYLNYVQRLLGDNEGAMQEQQIAAFADDRRAWRKPCGRLLRSRRMMMMIMDASCVCPRLHSYTNAYTPTCMYLRTHTRNSHPHHQTHPT